MKIARYWFLLAILAVGGLEPLEAVQDNAELAAAEQFVQWLADGDFATASGKCDGTMRTVAPPDKLKQIWESVVAKVGPLKSRLGTRTEQLGEYEVMARAVEASGDDAASEPLEIELPRVTLCQHWAVSLLVAKVACDKTTYATKDRPVL